MLVRRLPTFNAKYCNKRYEHADSTNYCPRQSLDFPVASFLTDASSSIDFLARALESTNYRPSGVMLFLQRLVVLISVIPFGILNKVTNVIEVRSPVMNMRNDVC